jgi:multicomponent Na+:H+ antiporter subunit G
VIGILIAVLLLFGCLFVLVASIGLVRFPDVYTRMHAAAKAGAFGGSVVCLAAGIGFGYSPVWVEVLLIILFFYLTTPVASHMIGRAAYLNRTRLWSGTTSDELEGKYDLHNKVLRGRDKNQG